MTVISMVEAARIAKVSRQAIYALKAAHIKMKRSYPFFCLDPISKMPGIDIDSADWENYLQRNRFNVCKKTGEKPRKTAQQADGSTVDTFIKLLKIMEKAIAQVMDPSRKELRKIKGLCMNMYQEGKKSE